VARWREMLNSAKRPAPTKVSRNGQIVLPAKVRRAAGIEPGDLVVTVPAAPGVLLVERVGGAPRAGWREFLQSEDNPLRGAFGSDPQAYVDELRGRWPDEPGS
jgi:AbrB family looped-hinge helix DNA binding protein